MNSANCYLSQRFDESLLKVWVHGDGSQREILGTSGDAGMVRLQLRLRRRAPRTALERSLSYDFELTPPTRKPKKRPHKQVSKEEEVSRWMLRRAVPKDFQHLLRGPGRRPVPPSQPGRINAIRC